MKVKSCLSILLINLLFSFNLLGQENVRSHENLECGTILAEDAHPVTQSRINERWQMERGHYLELVQDAKRSLSTDYANIRMIPVQLHSIRTTAGTGGTGPFQYEKALALANEIYLAGGIHLYQCSPINYIDDDTYYDYHKSQKHDLDASYGVANVLNIYLANTVTNNSNEDICGHAEFPGGLDLVVLSVGCGLNGSTFSHEVGHYFNLYHTHQSGDELVSGANCAVSGDLLCDTPADPKLSSSSNVEDAGCIYYGSETDAAGDSYDPSTSNLMSYSAKNCRVHFTDEQYARMLASIDSDRTYLTCSSSLKSAFYSIQDYGNCDNTLQTEFANVSTGTVTNYTWDFGDGNTSTDASPIHTYNTAGSYDVQLTVEDGTAVDVETKNFEIAVGAVALPYNEDFEAGASDLGRFKIGETYKNNIQVDAAAANGAGKGLALYGHGVAPNTSSPYYKTPTAGTAFEELWNPFFKSTAYLCVDGQNYEDITLDFDLKQMYKYESIYSIFRITVNGTQVAAYQSNSSENWSTKSIDLSAYGETIFTIGFEGTHKYGINDNATFIDNISITGALILPVELVSFDAKANQKNQVELHWETASQENFSHFEVEHRTEGSPFTKFSNIATHQADSQDFLEYQDTHYEPLKGVNYYRLKMVDIDGSFEYSNIKAVEIESNLNSIPSLYPNPVQKGNELILRYNNLSKADIQIYQTNGQLIQNYTLQDGKNILNTTDLESGIYLYVIHTENKVFNGRLVLID